MNNQRHFLKAWLRANWKGMPDEQVEIMLQAANAIESLELDVICLRLELRRCNGMPSEPNQAQCANPID
jgi:hypothetical protein